MRFIEKNIQAEQQQTAYSSSSSQRVQSAQYSGCTAENAPKRDLHPSVDRKQMPEAGRRAENTHGLANKGTSRLGVRASISGDLVPF